jgi:hypothetical protein
MVQEGPKGVKWELGFANFFHWENGIWLIGTWNQKPKNGNGTGIYAQIRLGNGILAKFGLGNGIYIRSLQESRTGLLIL